MFISPMLPPLKRFGQHFLTDKNIINKIVEEINPVIDDHIIEIGPGRGAITDFLFSRAGKYTAFEIDRGSVEELEKKYSAIEIIQSDFLKSDLINCFGNKTLTIRVVGNIPYNITSPIIYKILHYRNHIGQAVLLMQDEAAKRFFSSHGSGSYGIIPVLLEIICEKKYCFKVSPNVFYPKPKVNSALIKLKFNKSPISDNLYAILYNFLRTIFNERRKTLKNSLRNSIFGDCDFSALGLDVTKRPEQITPEEYLEIARKIESSGWKKENLKI